jgi:phenylalanyl-tRNA synthetase beta chain
MPVITLYRERLHSLVGGRRGFEELVGRLPYLGLHIEEVAKDSVRVEYDPNRLDYSTDYGIARSLKGSFGLALGAPRHRLTRSDLTFVVDSTVRKVRPFIAGLLARGVILDDETIRQIISMQEDLHNGLGRKRAKLAIGIHDADAVKSPIRYSTVPSTFKFTPLDSKAPMSVKEILLEHPTGRKYASLVSSHDVYPIITDAKGTVLSFPPIINGNATKVTPKTKNLLIDVTGTDRRVLEDCLAILSEVFWDAGAHVYSVQVREGRKAFDTPSLEPFTFSVPGKLISDRLGMKLKDSEIVAALRRARLDAAIRGGKIAVTAPRYRFDLLHSVDLAEETMYGYGFERLKPSYDFGYTEGSISSRTHLMEAVRRSAIGLGLQEVMGYSLTSGEVLYARMGREAKSPLKVAASKSSLYEYLRDMLAPTLLQLMADNLHEQYPQRVFEMAEVFSPAPGSETGVKEELHLGAAMTDNAAGFTDAKSALDTILLRTFAAKAGYKAIKDPLFIEGRGAECLYRGKKLGKVGEVSPRIVLSFGLRTPVAIFEISLSPFLARVSKQERV